MMEWYHLTLGTGSLRGNGLFPRHHGGSLWLIVLTGAMRSFNELGSDGVYNYLSASRVATDMTGAADKGVLWSL